MKTLLLALVLAAALAAACGSSSSSSSQSYKLGQYDGSHRLNVSAQAASPQTIKRACATQLHSYEGKIATYKKYAALPVNKGHVADLKKVFLRASTPDFTMSLTDLNNTEYTSGCTNALRSKVAN